MRLCRGCLEEYDPCLPDCKVCGSSDGYVDPEVLEIPVSDDLPTSEYSPEFLAAMLAYMNEGFKKHGELSHNGTVIFSVMSSLYEKLDKYRETGDLEHLIHVSNYAMIEFMHPAQIGAHYTKTKIVKEK